MFVFGPLWFVIGFTAVYWLLQNSNQNNIQPPPRIDRSNDRLIWTCILGTIAITLGLWFVFGYLAVTYKLTNDDGINVLIGIVASVVAIILFWVSYFLIKFDIK